MISQRMIDEGARALAARVGKGTPDAFRGASEAVLRAALSGRPDPAPVTHLVVLAPKHTGMKVDYSGLLNQAQRGLQRDPGIAEMLRQLEEHLSELGQRWYDGDATVVDEFLQLYCIQSVRRGVIAAEVGQP